MRFLHDGRVRRPLKLLYVSCSRKIGSHTRHRRITHLRNIAIQRGRVSKDYSEFERDLPDFALLRADGVIKEKIEKRVRCIFPPSLLKGMKEELTSGEVRSSR